MAEAVAGILYAAETAVEGAVALVKGITYPTLPLKAALTHITSVPLPRSHHTISVVKGRAYIFGGESTPGILADNAMHVVILPSSAVLEADYTTIPARPAKPEGEVPAARKDHTAVVIGDSIYIFGGQGPAGDEKGRVWVYDTIKNSWTYLDPAPDTTYPTHRTGHAAASSELPSPKAITFQEKAPQQPADPAKVVPEPADENTWGTIFIVGGKSIEENGEPLNDGLAFDVKSRTWSNIPKPSGPSREGASLALVGNRLYRFGGKGIETQASGAIEWVDVSPVWKHAEGGTTALKSGWTWEEVAAASEAGADSVPQARSGAGLTGATTGQGRQYLLAVGGESESGSFFDDIWAFQLPPEKATAASAKDATRGAIKLEKNEGKWAEVVYKHLDDTGEELKEIPGEPKKGAGARGHFAVAEGTEVDGGSAVIWGGTDAKGDVLGDGWLVTVEK